MRNKKKLKQAILNVHVAVVILVITIVSISSSYFVKAEENNKKIIMDVVENYFAERMDVLSKLEMNSSEKYLAKQGKASLQLEKYADKEGYIIGESTKYKGQVLCIMKKVKEESILKNKIFEQRNGKIKCIFEFI